MARTTDIYQDYAREKAAYNRAKGKRFVRRAITTVASSAVAIPTSFATYSHLEKNVQLGHEAYQAGMNALFGTVVMAADLAATVGIPLLATLGTAIAVSKITRAFITKDPHKPLEPQFLG